MNEELAVRIGLLKTSKQIRRTSHSAKALNNYAYKGETHMSVEIIFKIAGIGLITAIVNQILKQLGKEEIASITTLAGLVICFLMVLDLVQDLFNTVKNLFSF